MGYYARHLHPGTLGSACALKMPNKGKKKTPNTADALFLENFARLLKAGALDSLLSEAGFLKNGARAAASLASSCSAPSPAGATTSRSKEADRSDPTQGQQAIPGWVQVKQKKTSPTTVATDTLDPLGWSVPVIEGVDQLRSGSPGVCLASAAEARRAVSELQSESPMAIVSTVNVEEKGTLIQVLVKSGQGRPMHKPRYLLQLGAPDVSFSPTGTPGGAVPVPDTVKMVIHASEKWLSSKTWSSAVALPKQFLGEWLRNKASAEILEMQHPTFAEDSVQVVVRMYTKSVPVVLRLSGIDGVFARPFFEGTSPANPHRIVPLQKDILLASALRMAEAQGHGLGLVLTRRGLGLRVQPDKYEHAVKLIHKEHAGKFLGKRWEIAGLPLDWGQEALSTFLGSWAVDVIDQRRVGFRRNWIVSSCTEPPHRRLTHTHGEAIIAEAVPRARQYSAPVQRWAPPGGRRRAREPTASFVSGGFVSGPANLNATAGAAPSASGPANLNATAGVAASFVSGGPLVTGAGWAAAVSTAPAASAQAPAPASAARPSELEGITAVLQSLAADVAKLMAKVEAMETQDILMMDDADLDGTAAERNVRRDASMTDDPRGVRQRRA